MCPAPTELLWIGCLTESILDPKVRIKYVESQNQLADILTKGRFTREKWHNLLHLFNIMNDTTFSCSNFYSYSFLSAGKQSEMSKRSQESSSPGSPTVKAKACCLVSRQCVSVGQDYSSNPKSPGSTRDSQVWPWEERMKNPDGILFSMPRETERKVGKILEISQKRMPRETESTRER